jgi:hypothetical protein
VAPAIAIRAVPCVVPAVILHGLPTFDIRLLFPLFVVFDSRVRTVADGLAVRVVRGCGVRARVFLVLLLSPSLFVVVSLLRGLLSMERAPIRTVGRGRILLLLL